jgi:predicted lactoylglutathione lyase
MMFSDTIGVMLLTHEHYASSSGGRSAMRAARAMPSSRSASRAATRGAAAGGGGADPAAPQDHGFMFSRSVEDPDGNVWEIMWMDPAALAKSA